MWEINQTRGGRQTPDGVGRGKASLENEMPIGWDQAIGVFVTEICSKVPLLHS